MYTPHTVTLYNASENTQTQKAEYNITILNGVFLDVSKGANVAKTGIENADSAKLYIPFSVKARNGLTGQEQRYAKPKEYERAEDKNGLWTLRTSGSTSSAACFFVKGEVVKQSGYQEINGNYDDVYRISAVDVRDFGSPDMQHWQIGAK